MAGLQPSFDSSLLVQAGHVNGGRPTQVLALGAEAAAVAGAVELLVLRVPLCGTQKGRGTGGGHGSKQGQGNGRELEPLLAYTQCYTAACTFTVHQAMCIVGCAGKHQLTMKLVVYPSRIAYRGGTVGLAWSAASLST